MYNENAHPHNAILFSYFKKRKPQIKVDGPGNRRFE